MTSFPAQRLGLKDRGLIKLGLRVDLVILGDERVVDRSMYDEPNLYREGIKYVVLNGEIIIDNENTEGASPAEF